MSCGIKDHRPPLHHVTMECSKPCSDWKRGHTPYSCICASKCHVCITQQMGEEAITVHLKLCCHRTAGRCIMTLKSGTTANGNEETKDTFNHCILQNTTQQPKWVKYGNAVLLGCVHGLVSGPTTLKFLNY